MVDFSPPPDLPSADSHIAVVFAQALSKPPIGEESVLVVTSGTRFGRGPLASVPEKTRGNSGIGIGKGWLMAKFSDGHSILRRLESGFKRLDTADGNNTVTSVFVQAGLELCKDQPFGTKGCIGFQAGYISSQPSPLRSSTFLYTRYEFSDGSFSKIGITPPVRDGAQVVPSRITYQFGKPF